VQKIQSVWGASWRRGAPCHGTIGTMVNPALSVYTKTSLVAGTLPRTPLAPLILDCGAQIMVSVHSNKTRVCVCVCVCVEYNELIRSPACWHSLLQYQLSLQAEHLRYLLAPGRWASPQGPHIRPTPDTVLRTSAHFCNDKADYVQFHKFWSRSSS